MRTKLWKLTLAAALLSGSFFLGVAPKPAYAVGCQPICCDPDCTSVRYCYGRIGYCICDEYCTLT